MFTTDDLNAYYRNNLKLTAYDDNSLIIFFKRIPQFLEHNPTAEANLAIAMMYQSLSEAPNNKIADAEKTAEALLKNALNFIIPGDKYYNQINFQLGKLYKDRAKKLTESFAAKPAEAPANVLVKASEYQYLAVQHFQALQDDFSGDRPNLSNANAASSRVRVVGNNFAANHSSNNDNPAVIRQAAKKQLFSDSRAAIATLYGEANVIPNADALIDGLAFKHQQRLVKNDISMFVAAMEAFLTNRNDHYSYSLLTKYIDVNDLTNSKMLSFRNQHLSLEQVYKITRLCRDKKLVSDQSYLDILWHLESQVADSETSAGAHLRKKVRYQLLTTLNDLYKKGLVNINGFNTLYTKFMTNKAGYNLALMAGDNKAENVKRFFDQVIDKGIIPIQNQRRVQNFAREYTPIVGPVQHFVNTFNIVSYLTRGLAKWPLLILGSVLDIVLIIPLILKLIDGIFSGNLNWSKSWFAGLLGHVIGNMIIGIAAGIVASLALTAIIYPIRLIGSLIRRGVESYQRWSAEQDAKNQNANALEQAKPFNAERLNQDALDMALTKGIVLQQKPKNNYLQADKEFKRYGDGSTYRQIFSFIKPTPSAPPVMDSDDDLAPSAPSAVEAGVQYYQQPNIAADEENPYLVPPSLRP